MADFVDEGIDVAFRGRGENGLSGRQGARPKAWMT